VEISNWIKDVYDEERCVFKFRLMRYGCVERYKFVIKWWIDDGVGFM
jgi:hypothetical protein